jgi:hypothetical protein
MHSGIEPRIERLGSLGIRRGGGHSAGDEAQPTRFGGEIAPER